MIRSYAYRIEGFVQGVYYRVNAQREAQRLNLTGFVRNQSDGSVYAVACGDPDALAAFEAWLWKGPAQANVTRVVKTESDLMHFTRFDVEE